jgi:hypothetical protein
MLRIIALAALMSLPAVAMAQTAPADSQTASELKQAETGKPPARIRNVQLTASEKCPPAVGDEVVVCSTITDPYRIPKALRNPPKHDAASQSWVNRAAVLDDVGRRAGGLPDTCSPVGSGGQTGCTAAMLQQYAAEKAEKKREDSAVP